MDSTFPKAIEHLRLMEDRIRHQEEAIAQLESEGADISAADRRLGLLHLALEEMRIQLAQLALTEDAVSPPAWALPLDMLGSLRN